MITLYQMASYIFPQLPRCLSQTFLLCFPQSHGFEGSHWLTVICSPPVLPRRKCPKWLSCSGSRWRSGQACCGRAGRGRRLFRERKKLDNSSAYRSDTVFTVSVQEGRG